MNKTLSSIALAATALLAACNSKHTEQNQGFDTFKNKFIEKYWQLNPTAALYAGYHKYDTTLVVPSLETIAQQNQSYQALLDSLHQFKAEALNDNNKIDYMMLENQLNAGLWYNNSFKSYEWNPAEYNVGGDFAQIISEHYDNLNNRLRVVSKRLNKVPAFYAAAKQLLKTPTIAHTSLAIDQNKGAISVFESLLNDSLNKSTLSEEEKIEIRLKADAAKKAIIGYVTWLEKDVQPTLTPLTAHSFRIGKELYSKKFDFDIVSGYSADQIYAKALKRKQELHREMYKISKSLWSKYYGNKAIPTDSLAVVKAMIDTLSTRHVNRDSFIVAIKKQLPTLIDFISKKNILYIDPSKPLVVRETPQYMRGVAGASISSPGPYEKGGNTYYNVTPLDGYTDPKMAESYLREYNQYILQVLNIHEAIPGHYTQLVYSNQSPSLVKSLFGNGAMVEGWAVYTERMMLEEGYPNLNGEAEPEMWLMYYKWHLRVVCNTILDYSVHVLNLSKDDALKLLMNEAFQQRAEAEGKWRRVSVTQVQLCSYFTGFSEIYDFREELKQKQGKDFSLKAFHEKFLSYGSAPVKYIKQLMTEGK